MPKVINVTVKNRILTLDNPCQKIIGGNSGYVIHFKFDEEWTPYKVKTALFGFGEDTREVVFEGNDCECPVIYNATACVVGVIAGSIVSTTPVWIKCALCISDVTGKPEPPPEDVYNQIMDMLNDIAQGGGANYNETIISLSINGDTLTYIKGDGSVHTLTIEDDNTTYSLGTDTQTGLTKLYATTGSAEDGTMTQKAIKTALDKKVGVYMDNSRNTLTFTAD